MNPTELRDAKASLTVRNIGGIEDSEVEIPPGMTVLVGRNATNRTSMLQALMAACGSDNIRLKGDADKGHVELTLNDTTYTRHVSRKNGTIQTEGNPHLEDSTIADLFAFLLESNEARQAVVRGDDLRDLIMRPVDTEAIQAEIDRLEAERQKIDNKLDAIDDAKERLTEAKQQRRHLTQQIEAKQEELETKQAELDSADADIEETRAEKAEIDEKFDELDSVRTSLEEIKARLDTERDSLKNLQEERTRVEADLKELPSVPAGEVQELDAEISTLRERKQIIEEAMNQLQRVIQFNETMLEDDTNEILTALDDNPEEEDGAITNQLVETTSPICWTCGSEVDSEAIETTFDKLRNLRKTKLNEAKNIDDEIDEIKSQKQELESQQHQRTSLERKVEELDNDIEATAETIDDLKIRRDELTEEIDRLETEIEELENETYNYFLNVHKEVNQLEFGLEQLEEERQEITDEIAEIEAQIDEEDGLKTQREAIQEELVDHRTRIEQLESKAIEQFNTQMDELLDLMNFTNLERIWLERQETEIRDGRRKVAKTIFELHVVRSTTEGASYEDTVAHLSESEREVTGLVFALAGYLAHDVYESLPFLLLDSLEAIDSKRIATLINYVSDYADFVIVALLPEDAAALDGRYHRITDI